MTTSIDRYLRQFQASNDAIIALAASCDDDQWQRRSASEGWTVAAIAHHVAVRNGVVAGMIGRLVSGDPDILVMSRAELHDENARHAEEHAMAEKAATLDLLRLNGDLFSRALQRIETDDIVDRTIEIFDGNELSVAYLIQHVVINHADIHGESIRATIAG